VAGKTFSTAPRLAIAAPTRSYNALAAPSAGESSACYGRCWRDDAAAWRRPLWKYAQERRLTDQLRCSFGLHNYSLTERGRLRLPDLWSAPCSDIGVFW
jgi:hypothetical protein